MRRWQATKPTARNGRGVSRGIPERVYVTNVSKAVELDPAKLESVDLERRVAWIYGDQAKGRKDIHVSLSEIAVSVLRRQIGKHASRVFTFRGKPIAWANTKAWRDALTRAEIANFRWHDLRHTWASWLVQNGTPLYTVQEMGAWESAEMVRRYAHLAPANLAMHAEIITRLLDDTIAAQPEKVGELTNC